VTDLIVLRTSSGTSAVQWVDRTNRDSTLILTSDDYPAQSETFFECLDETALEEDSTEVEDHSIAPSTFLDFQTSSANNLISSFLPSSPHSQLRVITPILRC